MLVFKVCMCAFCVCVSVIRHCHHLADNMRTLSLSSLWKANLTICVQPLDKTQCSWISWCRALGYMYLEIMIMIVCGDESWLVFLGFSESVSGFSLMTTKMMTTMKMGRMRRIAKMETSLMDRISHCCCCSWNSTEQFKGVNGVKCPVQRSQMPHSKESKCPIQRSQNALFKGLKYPIIAHCLAAALPRSATLERGNARHSWAPLGPSYLHGMSFKVLILNRNSVRYCFKFLGRMRISKKEELLTSRI